MTNKEKAQKIADSKYSYDVNSDNCEWYDCYLSAIEMAEWKEKQMKNIVKDLYRQDLEQLNSILAHLGASGLIDIDKSVCKFVEKIEDKLLI